MALLRESRPAATAAAPAERLPGVRQRAPEAVGVDSIYLLTQHKSSISALQLMREIGVSYDTSWKIKHKLMQVMLDRRRDA